MQHLLSVSIGSDYTFPSGVYYFNSTFRGPQFVPFDPLEDTVIESPEVVTFTLSSNDPAVTFDMDSIDVTIVDNDSKIYFILIHY